jgi:transposase-like protein
MATTRANHTKITKLPIFNDDRDLVKFLETSFTETAKQYIKALVTTMLKAEMEDFRQKADRDMPFNGYYPRQLVSPFGRVEDIPVPRFRSAPDGLDLRSMQLFESEQKRTMDLLADMHLHGMSQRKLKDLAHKHLGLNWGTKRIGACFRTLVEQEEFQINSQALDDEYEFLYCDGIWETVKGYGWDSNKAVVLCVLGAKPDGTRKMLGFAMARAEDHEAWSKLLSSIKDRGLTGRNLRLVTSDDSGGLKKALDRVFPKVKLQLCIVHKMRDVLGKTSHKHKSALGEDLKLVYEARTKADATAAAQALVKKWYTKEEEACASLRHNFELTLTYLDFPPELWSKIRSNNAVEREFREVRRRTKTFDNSFNDERSLNRYHNGVLTWLNDNYPRKGIHNNG